MPAHKDLVTDTLTNLFLLETHQYDEYRFAEAMRQAQTDYFEVLRREEEMTSAATITTLNLQD